MKTGYIAFKIAGIVFEVSDNRSMEAHRKEEVYRDFLCTDVPDVAIYAHGDSLPQISLLEKDRIFDSEMVWSLYRTDGRYVFAFNSPVFGSAPYRIATFDASFRRGEIYTRSLESDGTPNDSPASDPLAFPLSEVLMVCLLAQGRGLMVHACGIDDGGCGYLFAGNSTHGKTTMARLWENRATILNDDRIVLRRHEGGFWIHGTPWHGEYTSVSSRGVPLEKIFFLDHAETNSADREEEAEAASMLLSRCFLPLWDAEGMNFTLDLCAQLMDEVPCYSLGFVPDEGVLDFVRYVQ